MNTSLSIRAFTYQTQLIRSVKNRLLFIYHINSLHRAYLRTYSTAFAVFQVYLEGHGLTDNGLRAIEPAQKTGGLVLPDRRAFFISNHRMSAAPLTRPASFTDTWR